ncbi:inter alpha-trypsin inhibitor, heavy chain 4-like [Acanthaster planci]|uniref:Inter alpha-trypsin inhibitor, heavy chain 4-like n=1 Tax=Acanthaster planci TaxID=133434 RepID=A0A8B8A2G6_ACAPL|nr:inter alpha-trypsin inhibitor, heavy chain 4-like [Acanthaster planci]
MIARYVLPVLVILAGLWCSDAAPAQRASSFIASLGELSKRAKRESPPVLPIEDVPLKIREMQVSSSVTARFTKTVVECTVANDAHQSQEVNFYMELPKEAFISGFLM